VAVVGRDDVCAGAGGGGAGWGRRGYSAPWPAVAAGGAYVARAQENSVALDGGCERRERRGSEQHGCDGGADDGDVVLLERLAEGLEAEIGRLPRSIVEGC
jgi:hypothetical protein